MSTDRQWVATPEFRAAVAGDTSAGTYEGALHALCHFAHTMVGAVADGHLTEDQSKVILASVKPEVLPPGRRLPDLTADEYLAIQEYTWTIVDTLEREPVLVAQLADDSIDHA